MSCDLCPRQCKVDRKEKSGYCGVSGEGVYVARAALHFWEEPCISGEHGSGTVFFSGCVLRCVYCQNYEIAHARLGTCISKERLSEIFLELQEQGAENINLVTPTHYTTEIIWAVNRAREQGLELPIVYNCGGYESVETLRKLEGIVDVYLTDFKYFHSDLAKRYSQAEDYPQIAMVALEEMIRQQKEPIFNEKGQMVRGVILRHLLLPGCVKQAKEIVAYVYEMYGEQVYFSLMNQYTPLKQVEQYPELNRKVTKREYQRWLEYVMDLGVEQAFIQEGETAKESFIPTFDSEGV